MSLIQIMKEFSECWEYLYDTSRFLTRAYHYYVDMRPTRRAMALDRGVLKSPGLKTHKDPIKRKFLSALTLLKIIWWMGIVSGSRKQFWRQIFSVKRKNPSRFFKYLLTLLFGHTLKRYSREIIREINSKG